jgi:hypothetical protein
MKNPGRIGRLLLAAGALAFSACGSASSTSPTITPSPGLITTTFTGTLAPRGAMYHLFTMQQPGEVDVTLTKTDPLATIVLGLGIAQTSAGQCIPVLLLYNNSAQAGAVVSGTTSDIGPYCAAVYDIGNVADSVNYTLTVTHS